MQRSQTDLVRMTRLKSVSRFLYATEDCHKLPSLPSSEQSDNTSKAGSLLKLGVVPEEVGGVVLESWSPFGDACVRVRQGAKEAKELWLELWRGDVGLEKATKISDAAGKIYDDVVFGGVSWNRNCDKIVFVAEVNKPKAYDNAFEIKKKAESDDPSAEKKKKDAEKPFWEDKYEYKDDFGETLEGKQNPGIFMWDLEGEDSQDVRQIKGIPDGLVPVQPIFDESGNGILFSGIDLPLRRLGLNFCLNRTTKLYHMPDVQFKSIDDQKDSEPNVECKCLTPDLELAFGARFSEDFSRLVFMGRKDPFVSHSTCFELYVIDMKNNAVVNTRIATTRHGAYPESSEFAGLYGYHITFASPGFLYKGNRWFLMQSPSRGQNCLFLVDLDGQDKVACVPVLDRQDGEYELLKVYDDFALVRFSATSVPSQVYLVRFGNDSSPLEGIETSLVEDAAPSPTPDGPIAKLVDGVRQATVQLENGAEGYLWLPSGAITKDRNVPCVVMVHGGPFSASPRDTFLILRNFFLLQGVSVFIVNYRGSIGYGEDFLNALVGEIGIADVYDCGELVREALKQHSDVLDPARVAVYGGSHGGFLTGWLAGHPEYKDLFCAGVLWNPVLNLNYNIVATDIPDWVLGSAEGKPMHHEITAEQTDLLFKRSPASVAANVTMPCLTLLGDSDLRVPPHQGVYFHHQLRERGVPSKLYMFPDSGHAIAPSEQNINAVFELMLFLHEHLLPTELESK